MKNLDSLFQNMTSKKSRQLNGSLDNLFNFNMIDYLMTSSGQSMLESDLLLVDDETVAEFCSDGLIDKLTWGIRFLHF
jgi:hypothetical protein